jgi:hypothetical protein
MLDSVDMDKSRRHMASQRSMSLGPGQIAAGNVPRPVWRSGGPVNGQSDVIRPGGARYLQLDWNCDTNCALRPALLVSRQHDPSPTASPCWLALLPLCSTASCPSMSPSATLPPI